MRPIGFWSTGAANSESGKKNQNSVFLPLLKIAHCHFPLYGVFLTKYIYLPILTILLIFTQRGKSPVQQRLKNHLRLVYIHDCLALWKNLQPFVTFISTNPEKYKSNIRLKQNMSMETPTSVKEHLKFLFQL